MEHLMRYGKELIPQEEFQRVAISVPLFAAALLKHMFRLKEEEELQESRVAQDWELTCFVCPKESCRRRFAVDLNVQTSALRCPGCGIYENESLWGAALRAST